MSIKQFEKELRRWIKSKDAPNAAEIAAKTGLSIRWVQSYRKGQLKNPTLKNMVALWEFANK